MNKQLVAIILFVTVFVQQTLGQCNSTNCVAPACRCMSTSTPGNLALKDTPQLVFLAFDDAITTSNYNNYTSLLGNRLNPNGCPIGMTFFVTHEYNDYALTHSLYHKRQEIATKSMSHRTPVGSWASMTTKQWIDEIGGIRDALSKFANIPKTSIRGARAPFLQSSGDTTFEAMRNLSMLYDCSFPTIVNSDPPVWPYTLDQGFQHDCLLPPCPRNKHNGIWTVPMIALNRNGTTCSMADACQSPMSADETFNYLKTNFERHYKTSKAPFGIYLTANSWFQQANYRLDGYKMFLDYLQLFDDVYIVPIGRGLDWMRNPKPLLQVDAFFDCLGFTQTACKPVSCYYEGDASPVGDRFMKSCVQCPTVYPWTGNPEGRF